MVLIINDPVHKSWLPKEIFTKKLEYLTRQKTISNRRIWHLAEKSLIEGGKNSGDVVLEYFPSIEKAFEISKKYLSEKGYVETKRGYTFSNQSNNL